MKTHAAIESSAKGHNRSLRMARLRRFTCGGPAAAVVVLAVLVSGCHPKRACDALPPLAISRGEGTDAEYMPGYPDQDIVVDGKPQASDESTESHRTYAMRWLQEHGEPPLVRLAGKGDAARCFICSAVTRNPVKRAKGGHRSRKASLGRASPEHGLTVRGWHGTLVSS